MWQSVRISHTILRLGLAIVFLWFGVSKFIQPDYWLAAWVPSLLVIYCLAVFEIFVAISLASNMFVDIFAFLAALMLVAVGLSHGFNQALAQDIGLGAGLMALVFWPSKQSWKY